MEYLSGTSADYFMVNTSDVTTVPTTEMLSWKTLCLKIEPQHFNECVLEYNITQNNSEVCDLIDSSNITKEMYKMQCRKSSQLRYIFSLISVAIYGLIFVLGVVGNGLVIYVILRYIKMTTVTNMYLFNLALGDMLFLLGMPFAIVHIVLKTWVFGPVICRIFHGVNGINTFTGVFTICVMSADRYFAVCRPVQSMNRRTPRVAKFLCLIVWLISAAFITPVIIYADLSEKGGRAVCTIIFSVDDQLVAYKIFTWCNIILGYAVPVALCSVFYTLVVIRVGRLGGSRTEERRKTHRKVTRMVLTVIGVYVFCWLPYYVFQSYLILIDDPQSTPQWAMVLFQFFQLLGYANSMMNPFLYAFLSDNFRKSFAKAIGRPSARIQNPDSINRGNTVENSIFPPNIVACRCNGNSSNLNLQEQTTEHIPLNVCVPEGDGALSRKESEVIETNQRLLHPDYQPSFNGLVSTDV